MKYHHVCVTVLGFDVLNGITQIYRISDTSQTMPLSTPLFTAAFFKASTHVQLHVEQ